MSKKDIHKQAQSLIDFLTILKLPGLMRGNDVNNKEAEALVRIWDGTRDEYGNVLVPEDADPMVVANLTTKGLIKSKLSGFSIGQKRLVEITPKGRDVIKNIVLHNEKSAFDNEKYAGRNMKSASSKIWRYEWK